MEEHLTRYGYALWFVKRKRVLDLGCYNGYGTVLLSWGAASVTGYDNDPKALRKAESRQYECPAMFRQVDFDKEPLPYGPFDTIVSFEVLEHVEDPDDLMQKMMATLAPGGVFVFSVPHMVANRQHKTLFDREKITELIGRHLTLKELHVFDKRPITGRHCWSGVVDYVGYAVKE